MTEHTDNVFKLVDLRDTTVVADLRRIADLLERGERPGTTGVLVLWDRLGEDFWHMSLGEAAYPSEKIGWLTHAAVELSHRATEKS